MDKNFSLSPLIRSTTEVSSSIFFSVPLEIAIPVSIMDGAAVLLGAITNFLVMAMVAKHHCRLQNMDLLIFNLCLSDFLSSIFFQPLIIVRLLAREESSHTETLLRITASFTFLSAGCSSLFLVTLDRYASVRYPFHYFSYVNKSKVYICIGCTWIYSWVIGLWSSLNIRIGLVIYVVCTSIVISLTITLQILAFRIAKTQEARIRQLQKSVSHNYAEPYSIKNPDRRRKNQTQMNSTKTIIVLFVVYVGSWLPATLFRIYYTLKQDRKIFLTYIYVFNACFQLHACINPFIYVFRTRCVRTKFLQLGQKVSPYVKRMDSSFMGSVS